MRTRAIKDLCQLSDPQFFEVVGRGMDLVVRNGAQLVEDAKILAANERGRSAKILEHVAQEEAAKFFILLDAVRCPRQPADRLTRQLARFNHHHPKGIYVEYYGSRPADFKESLRYIELHRPEYYLDGPNDVDFILRNRILQEREERLYVDYVEYDGEYGWNTPSLYDHLPSMIYDVVGVVGLANLMHRAGFHKPAALAIIAREWRGFQFDENTHWSDYRQQNIKTLEEMRSARVLEDIDQHAFSRIVDEWLFPLHGVDIGLKQVDRDDLRRQQAEWTPGYW